jgi:hypothetical protein
MNDAESRATLAWQMLVISTERMPERQRNAMRKLVRAFGDAQFEAGRAKESHVQQQREMDLDVERLAREFDRRREVRS